ncbi:C1 family peptidase [Mucilaginibacter paludis]|uniref:Curculin domain protein (Mannose-binding) lectin n=1 Tax=Mucilaginibacter paludis DSM 18603 TaxID=714943 RepID=H1Y2S2_9SPHI|nr:C1 family peptidase [Mucilaginibacter paludis]EHQ28251.1 Curculin domain protein (mannose-binding) lectin [Mucilaginibacter paludis DSM 18603]
MKKNISLTLLGLLLILLVTSCKKSETSTSNLKKDSIKNQHAFGAILNQKAYLNTQHADFDKIKATLIEQGYIQNIRLNSGSLPSSIILNHPTPGWQDSSGACVSWSTGYALLGTLDNEFPVPNVSSSKSPWYVFQIDHSRTSNCDRTYGMYVSDGMAIIQSNGVPSYASDPYLGSPCTSPSPTVNAEAATNKTNSYYAISTVADIKTALNLHLPVEMGFRAYQSLIDAFNSGQVYNNNAVGSLYLNTGHAVCIVGYDDSKNAFLIQNSWGSWGGDSQNPGCMWFAYDLFSNSSLQIELYVATPHNHDALPQQYANTYFNYGGLPSFNSTILTMSDTQPLLTVGNSIYSPNNGYRLTLQTDGNLVLYKENSNATETGIWSSRTQGRPSESVYFQTDGNLVIYSLGGPIGAHTSVWASGLFNNTGLGTTHFAKFYLQDDGNFVMYWPIYYNNNYVYVVFAASDTQGGILGPHPGNLNHPLWPNNTNYALGSNFF